MGRVLGGVWEGLGRSGSLLGILGASQSFFVAVLAHFWVVRIFFNVWGQFLVIFVVCGYFGLLWDVFVECGLLGLVFLRIVIAWGERSSLVLALGFPCLPMLSLAYPCFLLRRLLDNGLLAVSSFSCFTLRHMLQQP